MKVFEIDKADYKKCGGNLQKIISEGLYIERNSEFVKNAFNFGNGTEKDFARYIKDNRIFCKFYDAEAK